MELSESNARSTHSIKKSASCTIHLVILAASIKCQFQILDVGKLAYMCFLESSSRHL